MTDAISQSTPSPLVNAAVRNAQDKTPGANAANALPAQTSANGGANVAAQNGAAAANALSNTPSPALLNATLGQAAPPSGADTVVLSSAAQVVAQPSSAGTDTVFDRNKVDTIKTALKNGQYAIDPNRIAQSFWSIEQMIHG